MSPWLFASNGDADLVEASEKTWRWPYRIVLQSAYCLLSEDFGMVRGHSPQRFRWLFGIPTASSIDMKPYSRHLCVYVWIPRSIQRSHHSGDDYTCRKVSIRAGIICFRFMRLYKRNRCLKTKDLEDFKLCISMHIPGIYVHFAHISA